MAEKKTPKQRRAARSAILSSIRSRRPHGHTVASTPRVAFAIKPTSVTPPHVIEAGRLQHRPGTRHAVDGTFVAATAEVTDGSKT